MDQLINLFNNYEKKTEELEQEKKAIKEKLINDIKEHKDEINQDFIDFYYYQTNLSSTIIEEILKLSSPLFRCVSKDYKILSHCPNCNKDKEIHFNSRTDIRTNLNKKLCPECEAERKRKNEENREYEKIWSEKRYAARIAEINRLKYMPYKEYLKTEHWQEVRKAALKKAGYKCALCGSTEHLNVHHRTYENRGDEDIKDVIVLCQNCHAKFHDKLQEVE